VCPWWLPARDMAWPHDKGILSRKSHSISALQLSCSWIKSSVVWVPKALLVTAGERQPEPGCAGPARDPVRCCSRAPPAPLRSAGLRRDPGQCLRAHGHPGMASVGAKPGAGQPSSHETWALSCPASHLQTCGIKPFLCFSSGFFFQLKKQQEMLCVSGMPTSFNSSCHTPAIFLPFLFFFPEINLCTDCSCPFSDPNRNSVWVSLVQVGTTSLFELKIDC